jgi:putative ABC transport system ATP-binding protein
MSVVEAIDLKKRYVRGNEIVHAIDGVSLKVAQGEFVSITGPSGAGKTTLLNLIGCMDVPTSGTLEIGGVATGNLNDRDLTRLRRGRIGFVFQHFGLLPTLTVAENVALPALFARKRNTENVVKLLERVGLGHRHKHRPGELSGGEMQRVAIARALVNSPQLLLADEPTGNLDSASGASITALFRELNRDGVTIVVVTHNAAMAEAAGRQVSLQDGRILARPAP